MEVDEPVITNPIPTSPPKSRPEEVRLRQPASRQSPSHRVRPASAYITSFSTESRGEYSLANHTEKIYVIKELVLKQCSKFYASGGNVAKLRG